MFFPLVLFSTEPPTPGLGETRCIISTDSKRGVSRRESPWWLSTYHCITIFFFFSHLFSRHSPPFHSHSVVQFFLLLVLSLQPLVDEFGRYLYQLFAEEIQGGEKL